MPVLTFMVWLFFSFILCLEALEWLKSQDMHRQQWRSTYYSSDAILNPLYVLLYLITSRILAGLHLYCLYRIDEGTEADLTGSESEN